MSETERKAKLTTAQEAYSKIKKGEDFAKVVSNYSEDYISAKKQGDLGWLKKGAIDPRFSEQLPAFETAFGYHIVKLIEGPKVVTRPFDAVKGDIRYQLRNKAKDAELKRLTSLVEIKKQGS